MRDALRASLAALVGLTVLVGTINVLLLPGDEELRRLELDTIRVLQAGDDPVTQQELEERLGVSPVVARTVLVRLSERDAVRRFGRSAVLNPERFGLAYANLTYLPPRQN